MFLRRLRYRVLEPLASVLPDRLLRWLSRVAPIKQDPADGWDFWMEASYHQWCRKDKRRKRG